VCASLSVSTTNPLPGETITVSGTGFVANANVRLELDGTTPLKTVQADGSGNFTTSVTLPSSVTGTHTIVATTGIPTGGTCGTPTVGLNIQPASASSPGGPPGGTSFTGVDIMAMVLGALALLGVGYALNRSGKRRHSYDH
jgi:hypothetical protein